MSEYPLVRLIKAYVAKRENPGEQQQRGCGGNMALWIHLDH
jgi:hypothetical protein